MSGAAAVTSAAGVHLKPSLVDALARASKLASALVVGLGVLVLLGWAFDVEALVRIDPAFESMKPNTAILFVLLGAGAWVAGPGGSRRLRAALGCAVVGVAMLTLVQDAFGVSLGIDQLLFRDSSIPTGPSAPGRMSPGTSLSLSLLGLALAADGMRGRLRPGQVAALLAGAVAFLAISGYLYDVAALYTIGPFASIGLHTSLGLLLACCAILCARPREGVMALVASDTAAGAMVRRLVPVIVLLPSALGWMTLGGERADLYPSSFAVALLVMANIAGLGAMTWLIATSLKRSEQNGRLIHAELAERERDLAITLDSIGDAVIATDELGRVVRMNPVAEALTGWTLAESRGRPLAEVFQIRDEETGEAAESPVERVLREGRVVGLANHTVLVSRDGTSRPIADSGAPIRLPSGAVRGVVLVFRDMTEKAAADEALLRSGQRLQLLADSARQFSAATTDLRGLLDLVARRVSQVIGEACMIRLLTPDRQWFELTAGSTYHPDPELLAGIREVLATRRQRVGEGIAGRVAATGEPTLMPVITPEQLAAETPPTYLPIAERMRIASVLTVPLVSNDRVIGVISMTRSDPANPYTIDDMHLAQDLADRAALAIANAALLLELEQRVSQRTAALERANRELEAFSYSVSHDLRAPLRAINGFSQALIDECGERLDQTGQHYLERVLQGTVRMAGLIDDLLRLSQIGRGEIRPGPIDLSGLAHSVIEELRKREPSRAVDVAIDDGVEGLGDSSLVTIVLENLLGNAWKFTTRRSPAQIAFGSRPGDPLSPTVFFVRDNGTGFDMTRAGKLFAPFQRLHSASEFDGTGIGLATVSRIISRHGGRVWAEAAVDQGATFFFTLSDAGR